MADIEKAIRILEGSYKNFVLRHNGELLTVNELIAMLKAQQPRAMTLEEVRLLGKDDVVWYENKGVFVQPRPRVVEFVFDEHITFTDGGILSLSSDDYRKRWILWTSRPTDAQREVESRYGEQD